MPRAEEVEVTVKKSHASDGQLYKPGDKRKVFPDIARQLKQFGFIEGGYGGASEPEREDVERQAGHLVQKFEVFDSSEVANGERIQGVDISEQDRAWGNVSLRHRRALENAGYDALGVKDAKDDDLLQVAGVGPAALKEIRKALE
jgi:hypothetical protein